jgi:hypothetical protein
MPVIRLLRYSREAVEEALQRGEAYRFENTIPTLLDEVLALAEQLGVMDGIEALPDPRKHAYIPLPVICVIALCRFLYASKSYRQVGDQLLRSHTLLQRLGVLPAICRKGGYYQCERAEDEQASWRGAKLLDEERITEVVSLLDIEELHTLIVRFVQGLRKRQPQLFRRGLFIMDSNHFRLKGSREEYKWCCLMLWTPHGLIPVAMECCATKGEGTGEPNVGERVLKRALAAYGDGFLKTVLMDTGYEDGELLHWLKESHGIDWVMDPSSNTKVAQGMLAAIHDKPQRPWIRVEAPKLEIPKQQLPVRHVMWVGERRNFFTYQGPVNGCVLRDVYPPSEASPQGREIYQCVMTSNMDWKGAKIHDLWRMRWCIESTFGAMTEYWGLGKWQHPRLEAYRSTIVFMALTFGLLSAYLYEKHQKVPLRGVADRLHWEAENRVLVVCGSAAVVATPSMLTEWARRGLLNTKGG